MTLRRCKKGDHPLPEKRRMDGAEGRGDVPPRQCATASPSRTILANGRAMTAAVMATNSTHQSRPQADVFAVLMGDDAEAVVL